LSAFIHGKHTVLTHERMKLLLAVRHARRQRRDMPVRVGIALPAAQAEAIHPFGRDRSRNRSRDPVNGALKSQKLLFIQIGYPVLDVPFRCDEAMAEQGREAAKKSNRLSVFIDI
jgi:hypothetical protein